MKLKGKAAVVTGASKGIGAEIARALAAEGASVVVNYNSDKKGADKVVKDIEEKGGKAVAVQGDVSKVKDVEKIFAEAKRALGRLDILVNNAGVFKFNPLEQINESDFQYHFGTNVLGLLLATKEAVKYFGPEGGSVINLSSTVTRLLMPNSSVYSATKASVDAITTVLSKELGPRKIRVNAINPGMIETEGVHSGGFINDFKPYIESTTALKRIGQPDDIGPAAVFLASSDSKYMTGERLYINGGM